MAEGFEAYHVPQQSRRDKLRVVNHQPAAACVDNLQTCALYDPSLISPDFINLHRQAYNLKEEGINLMAFAAANHMYADPHLNPTTIHDINGSPYVYAPPHCNYRGLLDQPFHDVAAAAPGVYKPSPQSNAAGQSLSLSLSSHHSNLPLELNLQRYDSPVFSSSKVSDGYLVSCNDGGAAPVELMSKSSVPLGPFTGYASVLKGSRFLKPAQQLLEELCDVGRGISVEKNCADSSLLDPPPLESLSGSEIVDDSVNGGDQTRKKSRLLSMLDEVYKRYKQYYQQMQAAVAAFESVAGLSSAAPFANLALKAMSKHFRCLKNAITDQLVFTPKSRDDEKRRLEINSASGSYGQRPFHPAYVDQPVWRPQRGLPERAVTILRAWLFEHFLHPYPTDTDKVMLAKQTGLSRNQVSNWFINARVRLWKPMVEEIHTLETRQKTTSSPQRDELPNNPNSCESASTSTSVSVPLKRSRGEDHDHDHDDDHHHHDHPSTESSHMKMPYANLLHNTSPHGLSNGGGVSLTLGLHQNAYPMNAARRFGLDSHAEAGYVVSGFAPQNRSHFQGQIMHDFVG